MHSHVGPQVRRNGRNLPESFRIDLAQHFLSYFPLIVSGKCRLTETNTCFTSYYTSLFLLAQTFSSLFLDFRVTDFLSYFGRV